MLYESTVSLYRLEQSNYTENSYVLQTKLNTGIKV